MEAQPERGGAIMALPTFTMRRLLEAGIHFGHNTRRWNPKMAPYIYGVRNGIHIMDLQQTAPMLHRAMTLLVILSLQVEECYLLALNDRHQSVLRRLQNVVDSTMSTTDGLEAC